MSAMIDLIEEISDVQMTDTGRWCTFETALQCVYDDKRDVAGDELETEARRTEAAEDIPRLERLAQFLEIEVK